MEHKNAVLVGLEEMKKYDGCGNGIVYSVNGVDLSIPSTALIIPQMK